MQQAVVFFAAVALRVLYGVLLDLPSFFLLDSWWLDFLIFGIAGMAACAFSIHPPGARWLQTLCLVGLTLWLVGERLTGRVVLPPFEGAGEAHLPMWRTLMAGAYAFAIGPVLRLIHIWSMEWDPMVRLIGSAPYGSVGEKAEPDRVTLRLWDIDGGRQRLEVDIGEEEKSHQYAFSLDGSSLASIGADNKTIRIWDITSTRLIRELAPHQARINGFAFSSDATMLTSVGDGSVGVWDVATGGLKRRDPCLDWHDIGWLHFSLDGGVVALVDRAANGYVWDVARGEILFRLQATESFAPGACFAPDGTRLAAVVGRTQVHVWEVPSGRKTVLQTDGWSVTALAFSRDGKRLASAESDGHEYGRSMARVWDLALGREALRLEGNRRQLKTVAFSPNGRLLAIGDGDDQAEALVHLWDLGTGRQRLEIPAHHFSVDALAFSPSGQHLAAAGQGLVAEGLSGTVGLWEVVTGKLVQAFDHAHLTKTVAFSPDGRMLLSEAIRISGAGYER